MSKSKKKAHKVRTNNLRDELGISEIDSLMMMINSAKEPKDMIMIMNMIYDRYKIPIGQVDPMEAAETYQQQGNHEMASAFLFLATRLQCYQMSMEATVQLHDIMEKDPETVKELNQLQQEMEQKEKQLLEQVMNRNRLQ